MRPLVSVSIITYNHVRFIADALDSALGQDWRPLQVVVADDGSNDGTTAIVEDYAKRYPKEVVALTGRLGPLDNCNRSLRACTGEYIAKLDGDDLFLPNKLRKQVEWFEADENRVLCGHDVEVFENDGSKPPFRHFSRSKPFEGVGPVRYLREGGPFTTVSVMVRSRVVPAHGFDKRMQASSDYKFFLDCVGEGGAFGYLPEVLAKYRLHSAGYHRTKQAEIRVDLLCARTIFEAGHPEFTRDARAGRARALYSWAMADLDRGDVATAQRGLKAALAEDARAVPRAGPALAFTMLPEALRTRVMQARAARTQRRT